MIKRLRRKFVLIMMSIVTAILLAVFFAVLYTTRTNIERNSVATLRQSIREESFPLEEPFPGQPIQGRQFPEPGEGGQPTFQWEGPPNMRVPTLLVRCEGAEFQIIKNSIFFIEDEEARELAGIVMELDQRYGVLPDHSLRYLREDSPEGIRIAFADSSMESDMFRTMLRNSLVIGGGALLLFFVVSILLARWAVAPVQQAWDRQRQFVADASHELKTPLTVILSNVDMLSVVPDGAPPQPGEASMGDDNEKVARRIENIHEEGVRMKRLIEALLTLARGDSVESAPVYERVDWSDVVTDSILLFEPSIYDDGKELEYQITEGIQVLGDVARLRQLMDILMDNALKYCPKGGKITVALEQPGRKMARLSVTNEGEPLTPDERKLIFQRFYRVDQARVSHGGFGLGLAIAQSIVEEHGGKIWAESAPEVGNTFCVTMPLA